MPRRITERTAERLVRLAYELEQLAGTLTREGHESIGGGVRQISSDVGLMGRRLFDDLNRKERT